ncbi:MAG: acyl carrier protein [Acutalibacteraceae bacterium]|nr:acyl carrier protein [Acutalibacteraceae bacterium]HIR03405.1 acyl carrier protein [Candidatus Scatovicinus merdipullorum]
MDISSEKVLEVINQLMEENKINESNMNESLLAHNIDSLKFIQIIVLLEEAFNIEFPDDSLIMDQYATFGSIVDMVKKL